MQSLARQQPVCRETAGQGRARLAPVVGARRRATVARASLGEGSDAASSVPLPVALPQGALWLREGGAEGAASLLFGDTFIMHRAAPAPSPPAAEAAAPAGIVPYSQGAKGAGLTLLPPQSYPGTPAMLTWQQHGEPLAAWLRATNTQYPKLVAYLANSAVLKAATRITANSANIMPPDL